MAKNLPSHYRSETTKWVYTLKGISHPPAGSPGEPTYYLARENKSGEPLAEIFVPQSVVKQFFNPFSVEAEPGGSQQTDPSQG